MEVINNLNAAKSCQTNDVPTKLIKMNMNIFANFIMDHFNYCIAYGEFIDELKHTDVIPVHKKNENCDKTNYRPRTFWPTFQKFIRNYYITTVIKTLRSDIEKVTAHSTVYQCRWKVQGSNR